MEHDSDSFEFQPTSGKRALNRTLCNGSGAMNTNQTSCIGWHQRYSPYSTSSTTAQNAGAWSTWGCTQGATVLTAIAQTHTHKHTHTGRDTTQLASVSAQINLQVEACTSEPLKKKFPYRFQLLLGFILHSPDVLHSQLNPLVNPTEELAVEVGKYPFFLL